MTNLINFANLNLCKVTTDCGCSEGHEVDNLISTIPSRRRQGFLVDHFVKPPVYVDLTFPCDVDIKRIVINRRVGTQKSAGFELFTRQSTRNERLNAAKHVVQCSTEDRVEFFIHGVESSLRESSSFKSSSYLSRVVGLSVKIFRTESSTVPALGGVEVWGVVSRSVHKSIAASLNDVWQKLNCSHDPPPEFEEQVPEAPPPPAESDSIPEEFIDPISCHVMTIPVTLPSGKVIDASTLEKYTDEQARLGRTANDPFTGVAFTDTNKPVVATGLRARLDRFLLTHADREDVKHLPRTVGSKLKTSDDSHPTASSSYAKKKRNVDDLLESTLQGLPSYLEAPKRQKSECNACPNVQDLFIGGCCHLMCRQCLRKVQSGDIKSCATCGATVNYTEFAKFHILTA